MHSRFQLAPSALLTGACVLALLAPSAAQAQAVPAGERLAVADYVGVSTGSAPAGLKRVAIGTFFVQFVRDQGIERSAGSFGMFQGQSATYFTQVRGAEPAVLQSVADALYDGMVADLKAAGIEVVPIAEMDANPDYQEIRKAGKPSPAMAQFETGTGNTKHMSVNVLVSAKGLPIVTRHVIDKKWLTGRAFPGEAMQGMTLVLGAGKAAQALKAPMLNVRLTVALAEQKGKGWGSVATRPDFVLNRWVRIGEARWEFDTDPYPRFVEEGTAVTMTNTTMDIAPSPFVMQLKQAVPIVGLEIRGVKGEGVSSRGSGLLGALGRAAGGTEAAPADAYLDIEPANFAARLVEDGRPVIRVFVDAIAGAK